MNAAIGRWCLRGALLAGFATGASAKPSVCDGVFRQASDGFLFSEGGLEPTEVPHKIGDAVHFLGFDLDGGKRYLVSADRKVLYPAAYVVLAKGCRLERVTKY